MDWFLCENPWTMVRVLGCSSACAVLPTCAPCLTDGDRASVVQGRLWLVSFVFPSYVLCYADPLLLPSSLEVMLLEHSDFTFSA